MAFAGLWLAGASCEPTRPVSVALIVGEDDPFLPYCGGEVARERGVVLSTQKTLELFRRADRCQTPTPELQLPDTNPGDGTSTVITGWTGCADAAEVRLYSVRGGSHTWPAGRQYLGERWVGRTSRDFSASEEVWRFLAPHHR